MALIHLAHQYELQKTPDTKFFWLVNHRRDFADMPRGPKENYNFEWIPYYEKDKYDVAILHLDQQCVEDNLWDRGKGSLFKELDQVITDIPKIVIMHGTPYYPEMYSNDIIPENYKEMGFTKDQIGCSSELIKRFKEKTKNCDYFIFNSHKAQRQWGFDGNPKAKTIWHGQDPDEWWDLPKEPRVVTMISPAGLDKYYDRALLRAVREELDSRNITHCHITVDVMFKNWDEYRNFLGRSLVYFNPTRESPMPRSRTEAQMSGCCMVSTFNQDAETYMEDGVDAFKVVRNPTFIADLIENLLTKNYKKALEVGQAGKKKAIELFHIDRYKKEWREVLEKVIEDYANKSE